jgi:hypothetical protein
MSGDEQKVTYFCIERGIGQSSIHSAFAGSVCDAVHHAKRLKGKA